MPVPWLRTAWSPRPRRFADGPPHEAGPLPRTGRDIEPWDLEGATPVDLELTLQEDPVDGTLAYGIDHAPFWKAKPMLASLGRRRCGR